MIEVCLAGATGWTGRAVAEAVLAAEDLQLRSAVARRAAGDDLGVALGQAPIGVLVHSDLAQALDGAEVLVDYTSHEAVKQHVMEAIDARVHVVVGSSGLSAADYEEIDSAADRAGMGVVAAGNFSLTAAMAMATALLAARHLPEWEIIDYADIGKPDVPSGTAREVAERLQALRGPTSAVPVTEVAGPREARGAEVAASRVHSVRLPSFSVSTEVVFGLPDERLVIRHDGGGTPTPYVAGTLMAVRAVGARVGLVRGLDSLLLES